MKVRVTVRPTGRLSGFLLLAGVLGCNEDVTRPARVAEVQVSPLESSVFPLRTIQLAASVRDANGTELEGRAISWSIDNTAIATVDKAGVVSGVTPGVAIISAASEGHTGYATVRVMPWPPKGGGPAISIQRIMSGALPVNANNVQGVIDVIVNVDAITITRIEMRMDSTMVCNQNLPAGASGVRVTSCSINTAQTGPNGALLFPNGLRTLNVQGISSAGVVVGSTTTSLNLNN